MDMLDELIEECSRDPEFEREYAEYQPEIALMEALVEARHSRNLTQKELAKRSGIAQTEISRIEKGTRNPSIKVLQKLAAGMDMYLQISYVPRDQSSSAHSA